MQKKRTGRMLCSLALSAVTLWGVSVTAPAKDARDALRSLKDETLGVMLLRYERGDGGEDFLSLRTSLALHATPLLREGEENIAQAWSAELEQKPDDSADETGDAQDRRGHGAHAGGDAGRDRRDGKRLARPHAQGVRPLGLYGIRQCVHQQRLGCRARRLDALRAIMQQSSVRRGRRCSSSTPTARRATPCRRGRNTTCPTRSARWTRTAT